MNFPPGAQYRSEILPPMNFEHVSDEDLWFIAIVMSELVSNDIKTVVKPGVKLSHRGFWAEHASEMLSRKHISNGFTELRTIRAIISAREEVWDTQ